MKRKKPRIRQTVIEFPSWGGPRKGAGRKPKGPRAGVSHLRRASLASRYPVHVTMRLQDGLPGLREREAYRALVRCFLAGKEKAGFRLVHYAVLKNHMHFLVEGKDRASLTSGLQGLAIRIAKALNRAWKRSGKVFADRYHDRILRTPREVRNALVYVLRNGAHHGDLGWPIEPCTSGPWFDGWSDQNATKGWGVYLRPVARAGTWLLTKGWRRHGLLRLNDLPAG